VVFEVVPEESNQIGVFYEYMQLLDAKPVEILIDFDDFRGPRVHSLLRFDALEELIWKDLGLQTILSQHVLRVHKRSKGEGKFSLCYLRIASPYGTFLRDVLLEAQIIEV
jgi:hypothetical protein